MAAFNYSQAIRRHILLITLAVFIQFAFNNYVCANDLLPGVGAVGDSLTDEYSQRASNYGDSSALNWVDLVARLRGPTSSLPELTLGDYQTNLAVWGSPRYGGYDNNFALWGANTATMLSQSQHTGISALIRAGIVRYVAVFIGTNDFQPASSYGMYEDIYNGVTTFTGCDEKSYASVQDYADSIVERYTIVLDAVLDAGGQPVMATIVDFGMAPRTASAQGYSDPDKRKNVTDAVMLVNGGLKSLAAAKGLPIVNMFELFRRFVVDPEPSFVGGVSIIKEAAPNPDGRYAILPDGAHPGTVLQSLLANAFIEACNLTYATNFTPLSDQEILGAAGIEYAAGDETFFDITPYVIVPTLTKYSGGTGEPNDPYQIETAKDLILLGETPEDYDKCFILTADIDLDPNLPGGKVFDRAVIAPDMNDFEDWFQGSFFSGVIDGNGHIISRLTITGKDYLGLFGMLGYRAVVKNLKLADVNITSLGEKVGSIAGSNGGCITTSLSMGRITADKNVGSFVGENYGSIITSNSSGTVKGNKDLGGLVGNNGGCIITSYSTGVVNGPNQPRNPFEKPGGVGGLVGFNQGSIATCFSTSTVNGNQLLGGLVGYNLGDITTSYSTGSVTGVEDVGGLVGGNKVISYSFSSSTEIISPYKDVCGNTTASFWDIETSGQATSAGGTGLTTLVMQDINTFLNAGWDFVNETINGTCDYWQLSHSDHPQLSYHAGSNPVMPEGSGTVEQPYLLGDAQDLGTIWFEPFAHYRLKSSIDLSGITWSLAIIPSFGGTFDGSGYVISDLHIYGGGYLGLFGQLGYGANVYNLGLDTVDVNGIGYNIGSLSGTNGDGANITSCSSTGVVTGKDCVGGLVGNNSGIISASYSTCRVIGENGIGGLIGSNGMSNIMFYRTGRVSSANTNINISTSNSTGSVTGNDGVGGLVGHNGVSSHINTCYSNSSTSGNAYIGSLVGLQQGRISMSYGSGMVTGIESTGGLVGSSYIIYFEYGYARSSFWDIETSNQTTSDGGTGKTTVEMQTATTFLEAGWDFVDEVANGTEDIWWIDEGNDYPRLWWELIPEN